MARNLRDKLLLVIQDCYDLRQESVVSKLEDLIKDELRLREEEREIDYQDLNYIQSVASSDYVTMRFDKELLGKLFQDQNMVRTLCIVNATVGFLRQKGLLPAVVKYRKK